jgi:uncharacterized repeat protein (TIGR01451 family)
LTYDAVGDTITYTYTLTNTGNVALVAPFAVADDHLAVPAAPALVLAPGATTQTTAMHTVTQADLDAGSITNTATASAVFAAAPVTSNADSATVTAVQSPDLALAKRVTSTGPYDAVGDLMTYEMVATNTGNVTLTNVTISDPLLGALSFTPASPASLAPGETLTATGSHAVTQADLDAGQLDNTAATTASFGALPLSDSDSASVPLSQSPALGLVKAGVPLTYDALGDTITYTYTLSNTGNVTLAGPFTVSDDKVVVTVTEPADGALSPGETTTGSATATITQADLDTGSLTNTASAAGTFAGAPVVSPSVSVTVTAVQGAALALEKVGTYEDANGDGVQDRGDRIRYSFAVTNSGNVTLHEVTISDPLVGVGGGPLASLAPGAADATTFSAVYTLTQADIDAGAVTNVATADSTESQPVTDEHTVALIQQPALALEKTAAPVTYGIVGEPIAYTYTLTNAGNVTLSGPFTVTDDRLSVTGTGPGTTLAPGQQVSLGAVHAVTQADIDAGAITNVASAQGTFAGAPVVSNTDTATVTAVQGPGLRLEKSAAPLTYTLPGQQITYVYTLTNIGNVSLSAPFTVADDKTAVDASAAPAVLAPGAHFTLTASYAVTQADLDDGFVTNVAVATAATAGGPVTSNADTATVHATELAAIALVKTGAYEDANGDGVQNAGDRVRYAFTVTNTGNVTLSDVRVTDPLVTVSGGPLASLAPGASDATTFSAVYTVTQADVDAGAVSNTATATGSFGGQQYSDDGSAVVDLAPASAIDLVKTGAYEDANGDGVQNAGDRVRYAFTVTNTGNVTLSDVRVTDPLVTVSGGPLASLAPGASDATTFSAVYTVTQADVDAGAVSNVATAHGTFDGAEVRQSDSDTRPIAQAPSLALDKTADRATYVAAGDRVTYTYHVTNTGNVSVVAPFAVDDDKLAVDASGSPAVLVPGASFDLTATATIAPADVDAGSLTNVASARGSLASAVVVSNTDTVTVTRVLPPSVSVTKRLPSGQPHVVPDGGTVAYEIVVTNTGASTVTAVPLTDTYDPAQLTLISASPTPSATSAGTVRWDDITASLGDLAPGASVTLRLQFRVTAVVTDLTNSATAESCMDDQGAVGAGATDSAVIATFDPDDVTFAKTADPAVDTIMLPGDTIEYSITAQNGAAVTFPATFVGDRLPDSVTYVPGSLSVTRGGTLTPLTDADDGDAGVFDPYEGTQGAVLVDLEAFAPGETVTVTFSVKVREERYSRRGVLNVARLTSEGVPIAPDASAYHPVDPLTITKTGRDVNGGKLLAGDQIEWVIEVRNTGLAETTNVVLTDDVPSATTYVRGSIKGRGADDSGAPRLKWRVGTLEVGEKITVSFRSTVKSGLPGGTTIRNQAVVSADQSEDKKSDFPATTDVVGDATLLRTGGNDWVWVSLALLALAGALVCFGIAIRIAWGGRRASGARR